MRVDEFLDELFEIEPLDKDKFLQVRETLSRIGVASYSGGQKTLWQSCHVLQKRQRYFIVHFKQLFELDGRHQTDPMTDEDYDRVEYVVYLLEEWGLIKSLYDVEKKHTNVMIVPYSEKSEWSLRAKYNFGVKKNVEKEQ